VAVIDGADGRTSLISNVLKVALGDLPPGSNTGGAPAAAPAPLGGDFDGDGQVDGADLLVWQRGAGGADELADWQAGFGSAAGSGEAAALDAAFAGDSSDGFLESLRLANANLDLAGQRGEEFDGVTDDESGVDIAPVVSAASLPTGVDVNAVSDLGQVENDGPPSETAVEEESSAPDWLHELDRAFESALGAPQ
jgi:hypothetical protein